MATVLVATTERPVGQESAEPAGGGKQEIRNGVWPAAGPPRTTLAAVLAVLHKDWCGEWRTRAALNAIALFAVAAPVAMSFNLARQRLQPETLAGLLWTVLLFAALVGLSRAFVKEEESGTSALLRLNCPAEAVLWGKALFNWALLTVTQLAAVPILIVLLNARVEKPALLVAALMLGDVGLAVACTLLGAIAAQARARGALFSAIAVPVLLPLLVSVAATTAAAFGAGSGRAEYWPALQIVAAYDVAVTAAAWMLFDYVWSS